MAGLMLAVLLAAVWGPVLLCIQIPIHRVAIDVAEPGPTRAGPRHVLRIGQDGAIVLDGVGYGGLVELRAALELVAVERDSVIEVRPDREARYELFLEVFTLLKRANPAHLRLDYAEEELWGGPDRPRADGFGGYGRDTYPYP